jgi:UDP-N-acetylglucosamine 2-epimerase
VTGSPMTEIFEESMDKIQGSKIISKLELKKDGYFLVSAHREENIDDEANFVSLMTAVNDIADKYKLPIIFSTHPRTLDRLKKRGFKLHKLVKNLKPFGFFDYNRLQLDSYCVLSDSGTLAEESAILGFNGVSVRTSTERPEVLDKGSLIIGGIETEDVLQAIELSRSMKENNEPVLLATDYQDKNVSVKVIKIIQSYTKIIDRNVWRKS